MKTLLLVATLMTNWAFADKLTLVNCNWNDPEAGIEFGQAIVNPFDNAEENKGVENINGVAEDEFLLQSYGSLVTGATPVTFPIGVFRVGDPRKPLGKGFAAPDSLELRVEEVTRKIEKPDRFLFMATGTLARTVAGTTKTHPVDCVASLRK